MNREQHFAFDDYKSNIRKRVHGSVMHEERRGTPLAILQLRSCCTPFFPNEEGRGPPYNPSPQQTRIGRLNLPFSSMIRTKSFYSPLQESISATYKR